MVLNIKAPENIVLKPTITVFGVGGAGSNAVNNMIHANLQGANFVVANTDAQSLEHSLCINKIQLGVSTTRGLGAGASPEVGALAAQESENEIRSSLENSNMVFITAGMGGGTGTGSAPIIARIAKELGILTVGVVTKPFHFEGGHRMKTADKGLIELQQFVDTLIVIPNQNLFRIANEQTTFADAFKMADDVLHAGVRGVTDLMIMPGLINLDFADIKAVMSEMGKAMMGTGEDSGEDRAIKAAESAISNPLLDHSSMCGARGVLINITGGPDMTLFEVDNAANRIREEVDNIDANIIFGSTFNPELKGIIRVSVVATGIDADKVPKYKLAIDKNTNTLPEETYNESIIQHTQIETIPSFNSYSTENIEINESSIKQDYTGNEQELRLHVNAVNKPENNSQKSSFLGKIWESLRTSNNQTLERKNVIVNTVDQDNKESDIHDIPAFLRKKRD
ncbi:cell division protein FtsZ [Rickettsia prowazekii str. GvV257]|uniref:Cell division protein FtsZ n=1 Tax=Rickettsia prowazekii (strain Madrid E) TaxID=272947 RepID=FTSZ_RICPR|nr:cell division protein FtsZ [Rickettsia prowazekii]Q9ZCQ3.1 RecName: Full=Cell division protein FtsZ [Rickettsia prowazekii str. Madrid E]EOB10608.1 NifU-like protein [Rickettsia prowazekii str. GvF12]AFE50308.1 cell division protein FtsZ [Rickettsia prowazekii str. Katsinyian]AFE51154.1 cell division protein FtsZ [Rickettsia prowazekii str. BuV67-CWPP]AFE52257.1 cell division protein FtsZ [Rickettsia prowazekii str. GvV257]AFE53658.1 cell division protein FtsZ [Rickettsia prowazekii str. R